jgi:hypothetical protein
VSAQKPSGNGVSSADLQGEGMRSPIGHSRARALLHRGFIGAGAVLLIAAFGTDTIYYATALWQWANFSAWLITVGLIVMLLAVLLLLIDFATGRAGRLNTGSFILVSAAALLSLVNAFGRQAPSIRNLNEHPHRPELVHGRIITKNGKMSL